MSKSLCASTAALALLGLASASLTPAVAADLSVAPIYKAAPTPLTTWTGTSAWTSVLPNSAASLPSASTRHSSSSAIPGW